MKTKNASAQIQVSQTTRYAWVAAAALIVTLILGAFAGIPTVAAGADGVQNGIDAGSARWAALGSYFAQGSEYTDVNKFYAERMRASIAQAPEYTDAAKFYAERMRASVAQASEPTAVAKFYSERMRDEAGVLAAAQEFYAANPELMIARRSYGAAASLLAANPELIVARQAYNNQAFASCATDDGRLAANPELALFRRAATC
jgi:hypothetical protein